MSACYTFSSSVIEMGFVQSSLLYSCLFILYIVLILPGIPIYSVWCLFFLYCLKEKETGAFSSSAALFQDTDITL